LICATEPEPQENVFLCPLDKKTLICESCFANFIVHCCEGWATENTIPIHCPSKECSFMIPEETLKNQLKNVSEVWEMYQKAQLRFALSTGKDIQVTCHICDYTELLIPAPKLYWEHLARIRGIGKYFAEKAAQEFLRRELKEIERKSQAEKRKIANEKKEQTERIKDRYAPFYAEIESRFQEEKSRIEMHRDSELSKLSSQHEANEESFWEKMSLLHQICCKAPLESQSYTDPMVQILMSEMKSIEEDYEILFEEIPDVPPIAGRAEVDRWQRRKIKQLQMQCMMINEESRRLVRMLDELFLYAEAAANDMIEIAQSECDAALKEPQIMENAEILEVERIQGNKIREVEDQEKDLQKHANAMSERILNKKLKLLDSSYLMMKVRQKLEMHVSALERQKNDETRKLEEDRSKKMDSSKKKTASADKKRSVAISKLARAALGSEEVTDEKFEALMELEVIDLLEDDEFKIDPSMVTGTSQFFVCQRLTCTGALCIRCQKCLQSFEVRDHVCRQDSIEELYNKVLETLAEASTMTCPSCKKKWQKDLACTHMTCEKCSTVWCYHCGIDKKELGEDWSPHNEWDLDTKEDSGRCPMYLHYKYGKKKVGNRMDGPPEEALEEFHRIKQTKAIEKLKAENNPEVWQAMMFSKFPRGIWDNPAKPIKKST